MSITMNYLSPEARGLLTTALAGEGRAKGLIVMGEAVGGYLRVAAGGTEYPAVRGDDANKPWAAFYELLDNHLIVKFSIEGAPAGYIVTPLGCEIARAS